MRPSTGVILLSLILAGMFGLPFYLHRGAVAEVPEVRQKAPEAIAYDACHLKGLYGAYVGAQLYCLLPIARAKELR